MTVIKSEPNNDNAVSFPDSKNTGNSKGKELQDSRPALGSKKVNVTNKKKDSGKDLNKHKFEDFLLTASGTRTVNTSPLDIFKANFSGEKTIVKKEPEVHRSESNHNHATPVKRASITEETMITEKKRIKTGDKLKKMGVDMEEGLIEPNEPPLKNPGSYVPITEMLYDSTSKTLDNSEAPLFQDLEQEFEQKYCQEASQWSLTEWINEGQVLLNAHTKLVAQLVRERIELSGKFRAITSVINDRAEALNKQGQLLDEKQKKIETLGKEILNII